MARARHAPARRPRRDTYAPAARQSGDGRGKDGNAEKGADPSRRVDQKSGM